MSLACADGEVVKQSTSSARRGPVYRAGALRPGPAASSASRDPLPPACWAATLSGERPTRVVVGIRVSERPTDKTDVYLTDQRHNDKVFHTSPFPPTYLHFFFLPFSTLQQLA